jgi:uncharacterized phage-associated protein
MTSAKKVADYIVSYFSNIPTNPIEGGLTNLKLQKLLYYTQVLSLQRTGKTLFPEQIFAWEYGATVPEIYHEYKSFGREVLDTSTPNLIFEPPEQKLIIDEVIKDKGRFTGIALMMKMNQDAPWKLARKTKDNLISKDSILKDLNNI